MKTIINSIIGATLVIAAALLVSGSQPTVASVSQGGEYKATTTVGYAGGARIIASSTAGTLGSVVITGATTGSMWFYDATTTQATSTTNLIAQFPASAAAGTYTFDVSYRNGLVMFASGTAPTSTITYRP